MDSVHQSCLFGPQGEDLGPGLLNPLMCSTVNVTDWSIVSTPAVQLHIWTVSGCFEIEKKCFKCLTMLPKWQPLNQIWFVWCHWAGVEAGSTDFRLVFDLEHLAWKSAAMLIERSRSSVPMILLCLWTCLSLTLNCYNCMWKSVLEKFQHRSWRERWTGSP